MGWAKHEAFGSGYHWFIPASYPWLRPLCGANNLLLKVWDYEKLEDGGPPEGERCEECKRLKKEKEHE